MINLRIFTKEYLLMTFDITTGLIVLFVLVFLAAAAVYNNIKNNNRLRNHIKSSWGKVQDLKYKP